ncbi:MAG: WS/DGAT domain-containing protein, partial [Pseudonocardia sp.]|nr:WS/DGAT domain-containing protein [Pseudonocardia sp.]
IPRTSFNAAIGPHRNWAFGTVPLATVKAIRRQTEATVNDIVMALCAAAMRRWLMDHDELPKGPLYAAVPVSIRAADQANAMGNQVSGLMSPLPTHVADPLRRVAEVAAAMKSAKDVHNALPARLLQEFSQFTAPAAAEWAARIAAYPQFAAQLRLPFNLVISNVPGPRETLYFAGAEVLANYPVSMISDGMGLNITLQSYRDNIDFGLISTPELMPDLWNLIGYLGEALAELEHAALRGRGSAENLAGTAT